MGYNVADYLRPTGTILIYGIPHQDDKPPQHVNARSVFDNEWTVTASKAGCSSSTMSRAIALIQENPQEFSSLIGKQVSLIESQEEIINFNPLPSTRTVVIV